MRNFHIFITVLCLASLPLTLRAATFELDAPEGSIVPGDIVHIPLYLNAEGEFPVIGSARIQFPRELLWARAFIAAPGWFLVSNPEYNDIDNGRGFVVATSGFEEGISGNVLFGTLEFVAVGSGGGAIRVKSDSLVLSRQNENIFMDVGDTSVRVLVLPSESDPRLPSQLFDIRLELLDAVLASDDPLVARVLFQSFGQVPTPVDLFFTITDETGKIFSHSDESIVVETEAVFTKRFEHTFLPPGDYVLHASTRYNVHVEDDFRASFSVRSRLPRTWILGTSAVLLVFILTLFINNRKKQKHGTK